MDDSQIIEIRSLLLEAADAIDRANAIVCKLDGDDRALLATPLDDISSALHFELLQKLYLRYPGLAEEGPGWDGGRREPQEAESSHRRQQRVAAGIGVESATALPPDRRTSLRR